MTKKKFEVSVEVNSMTGFQTYGIMAESKEEALETYYDGEIVREQLEDVEWNNSYGERPSPTVEEVEEYDLGYEQGLERDNKVLKAENKQLQIYKKAILEVQKELYNDADARDWLKYLRKNVELKAERDRAEARIKSYEKLVGEQNAKIAAFRELLPLTLCADCNSQIVAGISKRCPNCATEG